MILIVDDDNAVRTSISLALRRAGFEPMPVGTEEKALAAVRDERVELAILDMNLTLTTTGRQGIEILRKFRILRPDMPVIMLTAWGTIPLTVEALNFGAVDFITKPWSNEDLIVKVKTALAGSRAEKEALEHTETLDEMECEAIRAALVRCDGNLTDAARQLGITRQSLYRRLEKFNIK